MEDTIDKMIYEMSLDKYRNYHAWMQHVKEYIYEKLNPSPYTRERIDGMILLFDKLLETKYTHQWFDDNRKSIKRKVIENLIKQKEDEILFLKFQLEKVYM